MKSKMNPEITRRLSYLDERLERIIENSDQYSEKELGDLADTLGNFLDDVEAKLEEKSKSAKV